MPCFAFERKVSKNRVIRTSSSPSLYEKIANKEYMFASNSYEKLYFYTIIIIIDVSEMNHEPPNTSSFMYNPRLIQIIPFPPIIQ